MKKQGKRSKKEHLSKEDSERLEINKICGGFINIRERIKIMMQQQTKLERLSEILSTNSQKIQNQTVRVSMRM